MAVDEAANHVTPGGLTFVAGQAQIEDHALAIGPHRDSRAFTIPQRREDGTAGGPRKARPRQIGKKPPERALHRTGYGLGVRSSSSDGVVHGPTCTGASIRELAPAGLNAGRKK